MNNYLLMGHLLKVNVGCHCFFLGTQLTNSSSLKIKSTLNFGKEPTRNSDLYPEPVSRRRGRRRYLNSHLNTMIFADIVAKDRGREGVFQ